MLVSSNYYQKFIKVLWRPTRRHRRNHDLHRKKHRGIPNILSSTNHQRNARLWNHPWLPRDSSEYSTVRRGDNRIQKGCPNGTRPSECETNNNNLNSSCSPSGMSAPNGSSMMDPTKAEILWRAQYSPQDEMILPSSNNSCPRVELIAENDTATPTSRTETIP